MLISIARKNCLELFKSFPVADYNRAHCVYPETFSSLILTIKNAKSSRGMAKLLGLELTKMIKYLDCDELIFLGDTKRPWLYQDNDYPPVKKAMQYLIDNKISKSFHGAILVNTVQLPLFIKHLYWLTRCNASLPYFYFMDKNQKILGHICQYGNVHFGILLEEIDHLIQSSLSDSQFEYLQRC